MSGHGTLTAHTGPGNIPVKKGSDLLTFNPEKTIPSFSILVEHRSETTVGLIRKVCKPCMQILGHIRSLQGFIKTSLRLGPAHRKLKN